MYVISFLFRSTTQYVIPFPLVLQLSEILKRLCYLSIKEGTAVKLENSH
jgi:hypothetical protein